ncbi:beta-L-arabinofuranosidase domain-containing protein [Paraflavisolibacter sp. H34]|uniref:glycoside hydrolase family 127 protein n=1 Tax=Huijunlia imazamoxiresistens TaxID=3127457 RepID=UPI0030194A7F
MRNSTIARGLAFALVSVFSVQGPSVAQKRDYPIQPVDFTRVHVHDHFWQPKMELNAGVTIPYVLEKCRETGRIDNFLRAAHRLPGDKLTEYTFDDTDLYKVIEGASYALQVKPDPQLEQYLDSLIAIIAAAQEPDGYLYTFRTVKAAQPHGWIGGRRWEKEEDLSHELYNSGHLFEAAVAHHKATGKKNFLDIAIKNADLLVKDFGWGKEEKYPGHQIVELGLAKMYRATGKKEYLDLAKFFLDVRGPKGSDYHQGHKRVVDQHEAVGHAVRATYMYTGMADIAALTGDESYLKAIDAIWGDVAGTKLYITGGIGATGAGEAFGKPYQLPNMSAYAETCAAIANVYWNQRMFLLHGDAQYIDVLERTLYNGLLSGLSLSGNRFFYPNPLASMGQHQRSAWFGCACCISNMTRFLPSVPGYVYAQNKNNLYVNLYMGSAGTILLPGGEVRVTQSTHYPWDGQVALQLEPAKSGTFALHLRIPGWAQQAPVPGSLYRYMDAAKTPVKITVNGKPAAYALQKGYAVLNRKWKKGDQVSLELPMEARKVVAHENVKDDAGRFALQRGPIVYCLEGPDNKDSLVQNILVAKDAPVQAAFRESFMNGVTVLTTRGSSAKRQLHTDALLKTEQEVTAIPYYTWANRGANEMMVWIPYEESAAKPKPAPTIAATSKVTSSSPNARANMGVNDQVEPLNSADQNNTYQHWWPKSNTKEWMQYDFAREQTVSQAQVYWYDDAPFGGCRLPSSWRILYKKDGAWVPVTPTTSYEIAKDKFNSVSFEPVKTTALRLEVQLPEKHSAGVHEWVVK